MDKKVFISHSFEDTNYAHLLARVLKEKGLDVFTFHDSLQPGESFDELLRKELEESSAVVAVISENRAHSNWAAAQYGAAYVSGKKIVPVVIDDIATDNIPVNIYRFVSVDAKNEDLETVAHQVEAAL